MVPGVAGLTETRTTFLQAFDVFPHGVTALAQINPPLNLVLTLTVIQGPVAEPVIVTPAGTVHIYEVAIGFGVTQYTTPVCLAHNPEGPVIGPGATRGQEDPTTVEAVAVHPLASVTFTVYVPGARPVAVTPVCPLGVHRYEYAGVPPLGLAVAVPSAPLDGVELAETKSLAGSEIDIEVEAKQPLPSVTSNEYEPIA